MIFSWTRSESGSVREPPDVFFFILNDEDMRGPR